MPETCETCGQNKEFCNKKAVKKHGFCEFYININETPKCCGDCCRYDKDPDETGTGWCDEYPMVKHQDNWLCHPIVGRKGKPHILKSMKTKNQQE